MADNTIWFSGSSPDIARANEDAWRRGEYLTTATGNAERAQHASDLNMQAFLGERARADQLREQDLSRNQDVAQANIRNQANTRDFQARQAELAATRAEQAPMRAATVDYYKAQTAKMGADPTAEKYNLALAQAAAENGSLLRPDHAAQDFGLPSQTSKILYQLSKANQAEFDKQDAEYQSAADTLTTYNKNSAALTALQKETPKGGWFSSPDAKIQANYDANVQRLTQLQSQLQKRVDFLQSPKKQDILNKLTLDPATGVWTYRSPWRGWRMPGVGEFFRQNGILYRNINGKAVEQVEQK